MKKVNGITLISLVITIIILVILAGISINLILSENGIITRTKIAKEKTEEAKAKEKVEMLLLDLQSKKYTDKKYNEIDYIDKIIDENNMVIKEDIILADGWKFRIDRENLQLKENLGKGEIDTITITTPYIGTTSFLTKISYIYDEEKIEKYIYIVDDKEVEQLEKEYITENNLQPETIHTTKVIAKYKDGKILESNLLTIKTEPRMYLYNRGDNCIENSGGWKEIEVDDGYGEVNIEKPIITFKPSWMNVQLTGSSGVLQGGSATINKEIDYSKYKYFNIVYTADLAFYNKANIIELVKNYENPSEKNIMKELCYSKEIDTEKRYTCNITEIENFKNFYIYLQTQRGYTTNLNIHEVFLEK